MLKKKSLMARYANSYETKENASAGVKSSVMSFKRTGKEVEFYKPVEGRNRINIIPYKIKTKNHPLVKQGILAVGDYDYIMDVHVHKNIGASESSVVCLKNTFGKPCPICDFANTLKKQGKDDEAKAFKANRRAFYNVQDCKNPDTLKVFEVSHYLFEKELIDEARDGGDDENFVDFADIENGKEIKFKCTKVSKGGFEFNEFKSFSFEDRENELSEELVDEAVSFDEALNVLSYEEIEKLLFNDTCDDKEEKDVEDEPEEIEEPKPKKVKPKVEDDDEEEVEVSTKKVEKKTESKGKCPFGHKFGTDCEEYEDDCSECEIWDKCSNASLQM
jgi:hypothetical protein